MILKAFRRSVGKMRQPRSVISSATEASGMLLAVPAVVHKFIHSPSTYWTSAWCWALFWTAVNSREQTKPKSLPPRAGSLMYALLKSDLFEILLDTGRQQIHEWGGSGKRSASEFREGWHQCGMRRLQGKKRIEWDLEGGSECRTTQMNCREFCKETGRQETKWLSHDGQGRGRSGWKVRTCLA